MNVKEFIHSHKEEFGKQFLNCFVVEIITIEIRNNNTYVIYTAQDKFLERFAYIETNQILNWAHQTRFLDFCKGYVL